MLPTMMRFMEYILIISSFDVFSTHIFCAGGKANHERFEMNQGCTRSKQPEVCRRQPSVRKKTGKEAEYQAKRIRKLRFVYSYLLNLKRAWFTMKSAVIESADTTSHIGRNRSVT
jgi:hypothetical protein